MILIAQPSRIPMTDPVTGLITREWSRYLAGLYSRVGGAQGESTTDLTTSQFEDAGIEELKAGLYALADMAQAAPMAQAADQVQHLETQVSGLREEVAQLRAMINDMRQGAVWP